MNTRCNSTHNPGVWPYTARCLKEGDEPHEEHEDRHGNKWKDPEWPQEPKTESGIN